MRIIVDGDSCPNLKTIENIAKHNNVTVIVFSDTCHQIDSSFSEIRVVDKGRDCADFAVANECTSGDIVVTRDYGLASMVLAKHGKAIHPGGNIYTDDNINQLLFRRHLVKSGKSTNKRYRTKSCLPKIEKHGTFSSNLQKLIQSK